MIKAHGLDQIESALLLGFYVFGFWAPILLPFKPKKYIFSHI